MTATFRHHVSGSLKRILHKIEVLNIFVITKFSCAAKFGSILTDPISFYVPLSK